MNVAVTGATGFIGRELVLRHIKAGDSVKILTRKENIHDYFSSDVQVFKGNLATNNLLREFVKNIDVLYHCAGEIRDESKMFEVNVTGTQNLVNAARGSIKRWIQLSSAGIYGHPASGLISENTPPNPENTYELTKLKSEEIVIQAGSENSLSYTIIRPSNVYGTGMKNQSLFQLIRTIDRGLFFFIGKEGATANYIAVENVVDAMMICSRVPNAKNKIYNLSDWLLIEQFISLISNELHKPLPRIRLPKHLIKAIALFGDIVPRFPLTSSRVYALTNRCIYSSELIIRDINYQHHVSLADGIKKLVLYYNSNMKYN